MKLATRIAMSVLLAALASGHFAAAQEQLTLEKARELALSRSATLQKAALAVNAAVLAATAQGYAALPNLTVSGGGSYLLVPGNTTQGSQSQNSSATSASAQVSASETLFAGGKTPALVEKFNLATAGARENLRATRVSLIGQADSAFFAVLEAQASVDAAASDLDAAKLRQTIAQAKIDAGILSKSAYLQTQADTASLETALLIAQKSLASAKARMASLTGLSAATALTPIDFSSYDALLAKLGSIDVAGVDKLMVAVTALAKANSPALSGFALSSREADLAVSIARKAFLPTVAAGYTQGISYASSGLATAGSLSLSATFNLDLWVTKNAADSAAVAASQAVLDSRQGVTDLELGVAQALYEWISSAASISSSAKALDYARSNYDSVLEQFKLSSATTSDLSTAEALVTADETALITAQYGFLSNLSALSGLAGLEDGAKIVALVQ